jgi:hypothetical protein
MYKPIVMPLYDIRWVFEYRDGTEKKIGFWTRDSQDIKTMAAFKRKEGLAKAYIERKDKRNGIIQIPVYCNGQDFCLFKWVRIVKLSNLKNQASPGQLVGLTLVSRDLEATVYVDGKIEINQRKEDEKKIHYECFGR